MNKQTITDIFGNKITFTDKTAAFIEATRNVRYSEIAGEDDFFFDEFDIKISTDQYGKTFGHSVRRNNGKGVKALEYHQHNLNQINTLKETTPVS